MKKAIVLITIIIIVLGGLGFWLVVKEREISRIKEKEPLSLKSQGLEGIEIKSVIEYGDHYNIAAHYPVTENENINRAVSEMIEKYVADFKKDSDAFFSGPIFIFWKYELNIDYAVYRPSRDVVGFKFDIFISKREDKVRLMEIKNFKFETGQELTLKDVFKENSDYLNFLSEASGEQLIESGRLKPEFVVDSMIAEGTYPQEENFDKFALKENSVIFFFPEGQLAPKTAGNQFVEFKYARLKDFLKPDLIQEPFGLAEPSRPILPKELLSIETGTSLVAALTFDDGPDPETTPLILDQLKKRGIVATFFVIGNRAQYYPEVLSRIIYEGHEIGNHTWSHRQINNIPAQEAAKQINDTQEIIKSLTGIVPKILRSPYGETDDVVSENSSLPIVSYSIYAQDWKNKDKNLIIAHIAVNTQNGDIILMHDPYPWNVESLSSILDQLISRGFKFVTVSQLLGFDKDPSKAVPGKIFRPR